MMAAALDMMKPRIAAIITTYKPDDGFRIRIDGMVSSCDVTIVVDNTPGGHPFPDDADLIVLQDGVNKGLGPALNQGIRKAQELDCDLVALFDQDSSPDADFMAEMVGGLAALRLVHGNRCVVGPLHLDDALGTDTSADLDQLGPIEVSCLATSGMLLPIQHLGPDDMFSETLFLDFVDFDWCWRMRAKDWRVFRLMGVKMHHRLGLAQRRFLGLTYHVPAPYRHYFQFRDTLRLLRLPYVPMYSKFRLGCILPPKLLVYPFIMDRGVERLSWMIRGIRDCLRGVTGVGAAKDKLMSISNRFN